MPIELSWYNKTESSDPVRKARQLQVLESLTIGREEGADIVVKDPQISRLHAEVYFDGNSVTLNDRNSVNGVRIDGSRVSTATWLPGQTLEIGPFRFELSVQPDNASDIMVSNRSGISTARVSPAYATANAGQVGQPGRIELGDLFKRALNNEDHAIKHLFSGFLGRSEQVVDCGYLGALGFVFPEYSFWCVTNSRVCGLLINRGGWMKFDFGFIKSLNRALFVQPSLVMLWMWIIVWCMFMFMLSTAVGIVAHALMVNVTASGPIGYLAGILTFLLMIVAAFLLVPWVIRAYYRYVKAGCVFWTRELVPIVIPADRNSLRDAQRFIGVFVDQKRLLPD